MKQFICILMVCVMLLSLCACGGKASTPEEDPEVSDEPTAEATAEVKEEDLIDDESWDKLESLGQIQTENGLMFVTVTLPADFVGEDISQESIDSNAGETYTSGTLNEDGSVTYKMTKKQHKAMLDATAEQIEAALQELVNNDEYAFTSIEHNKDFTSFDVTLSTEEVGFTEGFMALGFYMYGGMYALFTGSEADNIAVNYYSPSGNLISTANSSEMEG